MVGVSLTRPVARLAFALAAAWSMNLHAAAIEAEGVASVDGGGIEHARRIALDEAVRQMSLQLGAVVGGAEQMTASGTVVHSATVRPAVQVERYSVVREWNDGRNLHVLVRADDQDATLGAAPARMYRKKVLVTPFYVGKPVQAADLDDVTYGIPRDIARRLAQTGRFQSRLGNYALPQDRADAVQAPLSAVVKQLAAENDSQFVLAGELIDAQAVDEKGLFTSRKVRNFEVRAALYDGLTGALLAEHHFHHSASGDTFIGAGRPFGSASFFSTGYGSAIDAVLESLAQAVSGDLGPLPFTARIIRIENSKVVFDAGATSAVQPGDNLVAYHRKTEWNDGMPVQGAVDSVDVPVATVSVVQVRPAFSIGELSADPGGISLKPGDYVRLLSSKQDAF